MEDNGIFIAQISNLGGGFLQRAIKVTCQKKDMILWGGVHAILNFLQNLVTTNLKCFNASICVPCILVYGYQIIRSVQLEAHLNASDEDINGGRNPGAWNNQFTAHDQDRSKFVGIAEEMPMINGSFSWHNMTYFAVYQSWNSMYCSGLDVFQFMIYKKWSLALAAGAISSSSAFRICDSPCTIMPFKIGIDCCNSSSLIAKFW